MYQKIKVLGIETSCDETSIAIVDSDRNILMHEIYSQADMHAVYGGVIPELAARSHINILPNLIKKEKINFDEIDAIAVTAGPGLIGGLIVGVMVAKGIASALKKPCIPINHLEGHALTARLTDPTLEFPYLLLLVSGGHCQLINAKGVGDYEIIGGTLDDAVGEAFDKVAKMLGLAYPGGPIVEKMALNGDKNAFKFPVAFLKEKHCNFSFSGLKTSVLRKVEENKKSGEKFKKDICASFQKAVGIALCDRLEKTLQLNSAYKAFVVAGGVAANKYLKDMLFDVCSKYNLSLVAPPLNLCTDNGAMIAWAGVEKIKFLENTDLSFSPKSRWCISKIL